VHRKIKIEHFFKHTALGVQLNCGTFNVHIITVIGGWGSGIQTPDSTGQNNVKINKFAVILPIIL
jgi:hypothetical protein